MGTVTPMAAEQFGLAAGTPVAVKYHMNLLGIPMELRCRSIDAAKRFGPLDRHAIDDLLIMEEELRTWIKA